MLPFVHIDKEDERFFSGEDRSEEIMPPFTEDMPGETEDLEDREKEAP